MMQVPHKTRRKHTIVETLSKSPILTNSSVLVASIVGHTDLSKYGSSEKRFEVGGGLGMNDIYENRPRNGSNTC